MGGKFQREVTYVYLWLMCVDIWQKPTQYCKAIILQLNKSKEEKCYHEFSKTFRWPPYFFLNFNKPKMYAFILKFFPYFES